MKLRLLAGLAATALLTSCGEDETVEIDETRRITLRDTKVKLHANSDERFRNTLASPVTATVPQGWLQVPATEFRLLNYRFGDQGSGEVWVSVASGGLLQNVNRWLAQFNGSPLDAAGLEALPRVPVGQMGDGIWVEAEGLYTPGMGRPAKPGQALAGIILDNGNRLLTIKMVGSVAEVEAQKDVLKVFSASIQLRQ